MRPWAFAVVVVLGQYITGDLRAQQRLSMQDAVQIALTQGPRSALAGIDTLTARADVIIASALPNPVLSASHSKAVPQNHFSLDLPVDFLWIRGPKMAAARAALDAARFKAALLRAQLVFDVQVQYTRALASRDRFRLSRRIAIEGDSLLVMVQERRNAGDASQLDVELALLSANQLHNAELGDSVAAVTNLLDLQLLLGMVADRSEIVLTDTLRLPREDTVVNSMVALQVANAQAMLRAAQLRLTLQHRSLFTGASVMAGFERGDPTGSEPGTLPMFGIVVPLPIFGGNRGDVAVARADIRRTALQLAVAERNATAAIARATRDRRVAFERARRDEALTATAERVVVMARTAYREGAQALPFVLQMSRTAVEALRQYIDDLVVALEASAALTRALTVGGP